MSRGYGIDWGIAYWRLVRTRLYLLTPWIDRNQGDNRITTYLYSYLRLPTFLPRLDTVVEYYADVKRQIPRTNSCWILPNVIKIRTIIWIGTGDPPTVLG